MAKSKKTARPTSATPAALKAFWDGQPDDPFTFARFYWASPSMTRESIVSKIAGKRRPGASLGVGDTAARIDVLLPADAPQDYVDPDFLVEQYERRLEPDVTVAFAQVTLRFPDAANLHHPFEVARAWARSHFVEAAGLPVVAILHAPHLSGSSNAPHIHLVVLPRQLGRYGWLSVQRELGSDASRLAAKHSWLAYRAGIEMHS